MAEMNSLRRRMIEYMKVRNQTARELGAADDPNQADALRRPITYEGQIAIRSTSSRLTSSRRRS
jgi:hypothetical protein